MNLFKPLLAACATALSCIILTGGEIEVVKAEYGADTAWKDVSPLVKSMLSNGKLTVMATNETFGDPAPGVVKTLKAVVRLDGRELTVKVDEDMTLSLDKDTFEKLFATENAVIAPDAVDELQASIKDAVKKGLHKLEIKKGVYRLTCHNGTKWHLNFVKLKDMEIDASGSTFIFETRDKRGMLFEGCENLVFRGATLLRELPPFSQGDIVEFAQDRSYVDIKIHPGYPADIDDQKYFFKTPVLTIYESSSAKLKKNVPDIYIKGIERLADGLFRFRLREPVDMEIPLEKGDMAAWRSCSPGELCGHEVNIRNCANLTFTGVTMKNYRGLAIAESGGEGANRYTYTLAYGEPPKGATRRPLLTGSADGFNSCNMRKGPILENCVIEGTHDDGINIHGVFAMAVESNADSAVIDYRESMFPFGRLGDRLEFYDENSRLAGEAKLLSVEKLPKYDASGVTCGGDTRTFSNHANAMYFRIKTDRPVTLKPGYMIANADTIGNGFIIRNCITKDHRAHGLFIRAGDGLIENCTIENIHMGGIVVAPELRSWNESSFVRNLTVRNNTIRQAGIATQSWNCAVTVAGYEGEFVRLPGGHRNILVEGNRFENNDGPNMMISSVIGMTVKDNAFINPMQANAYHGRSIKAVNYDALVWATEAEGLKFEGNTIENPGSSMKTILSATTTASGSGLSDGIKVK